MELQTAFEVRGKVPFPVKVSVVRYLLLSDIHGNDVALQAVLEDAARTLWHKVIFLGDAVGYYPQIDAVLARLGALPLEAALLGNHDALLLGSGGAQARSVVVEVIAKQRQNVSAAQRAFLEQLEPSVCRSGWEAAHSNLRGSWDYVTTLERAHHEHPLMKRSRLFLGHTHIPALYMFTHSRGYRMQRSVPLHKVASQVRLPPNAHVIFNPGSVGQPRDGIPLASYAVYDDEAQLIDHYRVAFDIAAVQKRVREAGYPASLAERLAAGR